MKYRRKSDIVDAIQFDGVHLPEGVFQDPCSSVCYLDTMSGRSVLKQGDWIVTDERSKRHVYWNEQFHNTFEEIIPTNAASFEQWGNIKTT